MQEVEYSTLTESPVRKEGSGLSPCQITRQRPPSNVWLVGQDVGPTQRRGRYLPESFVHPAKMLPELARNIIETYSRVGDLVFDPMSGIGTTGVESLWLRRRYIGIELEPQFVKLQKKNLAFTVSKNSPCVYTLIQGDARVDRGINGVTLATFSPPYQDAIHSQGRELERIKRKIRNGTATPELRRRFANWRPENEPARAGLRPAGYSPQNHNLGHFKGPRYWDAMREVFGTCYKALVPGGFLVVVTKEHRDRKSGELSNLYGEMVAICKQIGFTLHQSVTAILCRIDQQTGEIKLRTSHWQRMAVPKALEKGKVNLIGQYEDVVVFRKPES